MQKWSFPHRSVPQSQCIELSACVLPFQSATASKMSTCRTYTQGRALSIAVTISSSVTVGKRIRSPMVGAGFRGPRGW